MTGGAETGGGRRSEVGGRLASDFRPPLSDLSPPAFRAAASRNARYSLLRDQTKKPMSLPTDSNAASAAVRSGHQANQPGACAKPDLNNQGIITAQIIMDAANVITNHGITWTKANVCNVAKATFLEVRPIHMPNQHSAMRLPMVVSAAAAGARIVVPAGRRVVANDGPTPLVTLTVPVTTTTCCEAEFVSEPAPERVV